MHNSQHKNISNIQQIVIKKCWNVGQNIVVVIDKRIVERLDIAEENTFFEEELTDDGGILLRIKRMKSERGTKGGSN